MFDPWDSVPLPLDVSILFPSVAPTLTTVVEPPEIACVNLPTWELSTWFVAPVLIWQLTKILLVVAVGVIVAATELSVKESEVATVVALSVPVKLSVTIWPTLPKPDVPAIPIVLIAMFTPLDYPFLLCYK